MEVESTGDFEISLSQLETACDSQEKGTGISGVFLLKIASILREKGQLLTLEAKRRLAGSSKVLERIHQSGVANINDGRWQHRSGNF